MKGELAGGKYASGPVTGPQEMDNEVDEEIFFSKKSMVPTSEPSITLFSHTKEDQEPGRFGGENMPGRSSSPSKAQEVEGKRKEPPAQVYNGSLIPSLDLAGGGTGPFSKFSSYVSPIFDQNDTIIQTLKTINAKLQKLDTLENITLHLKGDLSKVQSKVDNASANINSVKSDLDKYEEKWEKIYDTLVSRLSKLESKTQSWENKWELARESIDKDFKVVQSRMDTNSKKILEFDNFLRMSKQKWVSLGNLEEKIKKAAEKKFQALKQLIKEEVKEEIIEEVRAIRRQDVTQEDKMLKKRYCCRYSHRLTTCLRSSNKIS